MIASVSGDNPTAEGHPVSPQSHSMVILKTPDSSTLDTPFINLICQAGGVATRFSALADQLFNSLHRPIAAFEDPSLYGTSPHFTSVTELANSYIAELKAHQPKGPYTIAGFSFGGFVVPEMARLLKTNYKDVVSCLVLADPPAASLCSFPTTQFENQLCVLFLLAVGLNSEVMTENEAQHFTEAPTES